MPATLGYCCINNTLKNQTPSISTNRTLTKKFFTLEKASSIGLQNCKDILKILQWNEEQGIKCFRISSDLLPRFTCPEFGYDFSQLESHREISNILSEIGKFAVKHNHILSFHPGPFTTLASPNESAKINGINEIKYHNMLCDLICQNEPNLQIDINIHIGGTYGNHQETAKRFIKVYKPLDDKIKSRLVVENDDKASGWSIRLLLNLIHSECNIPITFDSHHWQFCHEPNAIEEQDFIDAWITWNGRPMQAHYSQSENNKRKEAHSDYYSAPIPSYMNQNGIYIHLECKAKEKALLHYRQKFL